jgi:hypothetical protein
MNRLNIKVAGRWLETPADTVMKFKLENNIFFDNARRREYSMSITLPLSPTNNELLGWMAEIGTSNSARTNYSCELYSDNVYLMSGELVVQRTNNGYSVNVLTGYGAFEQLAGDTKLRDLDLSWTPFSPISALTVASATYPDYPYSLAETVAPNFIGRPDYGNVTNTQGYSFFGIHTFSGSPIAYPYVHAILDIITNNFGYQRFSGSYMDDPELQTLMLCSAKINRNFTYIDPQILPDLTVSEFLESISKLFCLSIKPDFKQKKLSLNLLKPLTESTNYLDWTNKVAGEFSRNWTNFTNGLHFKFADNFKKLYIPYDTTKLRWNGNVANDWHFPVVIGTDEELVLSLTSNFYMRFSVQEIGAGGPNEWYAEDINVNIGDTTQLDIIPSVQDYWSLPSAGANQSKACLVIDENMYYYSDGIDWTTISYNCDDLKIGNYKRLIEPKISPMPIARTGDSAFSPHRLLCPVIRNYKAYNDSSEIPTITEAEIPTMAVFNRGIQQNSNGDNYLFASSDVYDIDGVKQWDYGLYWDGENGLYEKFWRNWAEFLVSSQEVEVPIWLTATDWANLNIERPIIIRNVIGFIKSIAIEFPITKPAIVTFVKK